MLNKSKKLVEANTKPLQKEKNIAEGNAKQLKH